MAVINGQIKPKIGAGGSPVIQNLPSGSVLHWVTITIPSSSTYSTAAGERVRFDHGGAGSCQQMLGSRIIKQILFSNGFSCTNVSTSEVKGTWAASTQQMYLYIIGTNGTAPVAEAEVGNGTGLGAGTITCEAMILV